MVEHTFVARHTVEAAGNPAGNPAEAAGNPDRGVRPSEVELVRGTECKHYQGRSSIDPLQAAEQISGFQAAADKGFVSRGLVGRGSVSRGLVGRGSIGMVPASKVLIDRVPASKVITRKVIVSKPILSGDKPVDCTWVVIRILY